MIVVDLRTRAAPVIERASDWLAGRSRRERVLLQAMAALGLVAIGWYGVIQPLLIARQTAVERIALYESLQARLRMEPAGAGASPVAVPIEGPLDEAVRRAAAAQALTADVAGDADRVTVSVTGARFDAAVPFARSLESGGVVISDLQMEAVGATGQINLTLTAHRP